MNLEQFKKFLAGEARVKAGLCAALVSVLTDDGIPSTNELLAVRMSLICSILDIVDDINDADPMKRILREACEAATADVTEKTGLDIGKHVAEARGLAAEHRARIESADDILGGIDFSAN